MASFSRVWLSCAWAVLRIGLVVAITWIGSVLLAQPSPQGAALPIQWRIIPPELAARELEKVKQGVLILTPLADFEARIERTRQALRGNAKRPRLTRAHYQATLTDRSLASGQGTWTIDFPGDTTTALPIAPLNLAIGRLRWDQGDQAVLGELDGQSLGLIVKPGNGQCRFEWSARGTPTNDGIAFYLQVPACTICTFDLDLPSDAWLLMSKEAALVTGPHDEGVPGKRRWRLQAVGARPIQFVVRKIADAKGAPPTLFTRTHSEQRLMPDRLEVEHEFDIDILHGSVRELILLGDAELQPFDVRLKSGEVQNFTWTELPSKKNAKGKLTFPAQGRLTIRFHRPVQGKLKGLQVSSLASKPASGLWTSPGLHVVGAVRRGEVLELKLHPDLLLGRWDHGTYQLTQSQAENGMQNLTLADSAPDVKTSKRPTLILSTKATDLHTSESIRWDFTPRGMRVVAKIDCTTSRGITFELRARLPTGVPRYQIESLSMQPPEQLRDWRLEGGFLIVELSKPLAPLANAVVKIELRADVPDMTSGPRNVVFPDLNWIDATSRRGTVEVFVDPIFQARLLGSSSTQAPVEASRTALPSLPPAFRLPFWGQGLSATIRLVPQAVQVRLQGNHRINLTESGAVMKFRWEVEPLLGAPDHVDFRFAPGFPKPWKVFGDELAPVHRWERLIVKEALPHLLRLGCRHPWDSAALDALLPVGPCWRFHFTRPLTRKSSFTLETSAPGGLVESRGRAVAACVPSPFPWEPIASALAAQMLAQTPSGRTWSVPLMVPEQRSDVQQEIVLESTVGPLAQASVVPGPMRASLKIKPATLPVATRIVHSGDGVIEPGSRILAKTLTLKHMTSALEVCDDARISTFVSRSGDLSHRIEFRLWHWRRRTCELRLPAGLRVVSVGLNGKPLQRFEVTKILDQVRLTLPYDQTGDSVRYEILARSQGEQVFLPGVLRIERPQVGWPIAPRSSRSRLFLEGDLTPLSHRTVAPVGMPIRLSSQSSARHRLRQVWIWGQAWWPLGEQARLRSALDEQKQNVLAAEKEIRGRIATPLTLADALERLAVAQLRNTVPVLVDPQAFRSLGLAPDTPLPQGILSPRNVRPFWESLGLVYLPCPGGGLLTSPDRLRRWGISDFAPGDLLDDALRDAIHQGQDPFSGFCLVPVWKESARTDFSSGVLLKTTNAEDGYHDRTEWASLNSGNEMQGLLVVDPMPARVLGWVLAFLVGVGFWRIHRSMSVTSAFRVHLVVLASALLLAIWLPSPASDFFAWPGVVVASLSLLATLIRIFSERGEKANRSNSTITRVAGSAGVTAAALAFFFGVAWDLLAQPPVARPYTVQVINGPKPAVLVTPELVARLTELEGKSNPFTEGTLLIGASYSGVLNDGVAKFDVDFEVYSLKESARLQIPLTGVQLQGGAFLDGAPVFPVPNKAGYSLPIQKTGLHHLRLTFTARIADASDFHELAFKIPKLPQTEVSLQWKTPAKTVYCDKCLGEERVSIGPKQLLKTWHGRLGHVNAFNLRWAAPGAAVVDKAIEVHEAHFWDLRPGSVALYSALNYAMGKSALSRLTVTLPDGLQVRSVDALLTPPLVAPSAPILIKQWTIQGKGLQRQLAVDFVQPVTGKISLHLELIPRGFGNATQILLALPAPVQGKSVAGLLGYRLDLQEKDTPAAPNLGIVRNLSAGEFRKEWNQLARPPIPDASRGYAFERRGQQAGLRLEVVPNARQAQASLRWRLDPQCAEFSGEFNIRSPHEDLILVEFSLDPGLTLAEVSGPDVWRWQRQDGLLQVWLRQAQNQTAINLIGWRKNSPKQPIGKNFMLPGIQVLQARMVESRLEIQPTVDLDALVEKVHGLRATVGNPLSFSVIDPNYQAALRLVPRVREPTGSILTRVHDVDGAFEVSHAIRLLTRRGMLPTLKIGVKNWVGDAPTLTAPGAVIQTHPEKTPGVSSWSLSYPGGQPAEVLIFLRGRLRPGNRPFLELPLITVQGANVEQSWVAWKNVDLARANKREKLLGQAGIAQSLPLPLANWLQDVTQWKLTDGSSEPTSVTFRKAPARARARILSSTEEIRSANGPPWLHEAALWMYTPSPSDLDVRFPTAPDSLTILVDGQPYSEWTLEHREIKLKAPAKPSAWLLQLRWRYPGSAEQADTPNVLPLLVNQARLVPQSRLIWIPRGSVLAKSDAALRPTWFATQLQRAELHLQTSKALAEQNPRSPATSRLLVSAQQNLDACIQDADYALAVARLGPHEFDSADWATRIWEIQTKNGEFARTLRYDTERQTARKLGPTRGVAPPRSEGEPLGDPWILPPGLTSVKLFSGAERETTGKRTWTEWILLAMVALLVFSYFRHGWPILRALAPELAVLAIVVAMLVFTWSFLGIFLALALLLLRGVRVARFLKKRMATALLPGATDDTASYPPHGNAP